MAEATAKQKVVLIGGALSMMLFATLWTLSRRFSDGDGEDVLPVEAQEAPASSKVKPGEETIVLEAVPGGPWSMPEHRIALADPSLVGDDNKSPSHGGAAVKSGGHTWQQSDLGGVVGRTIAEAMVQGTVPVEEEQTRGLDAGPHWGCHRHQNVTLVGVPIDRVASRPIVPSMERTVGTDESIEQVFGLLEASTSQSLDGHLCQVRCKVQRRIGVSQGIQVVTQSSQF